MDLDFKPKPPIISEYTHLWKPCWRVTWFTATGTNSQSFASAGEAASFAKGK